MPVAQARTARIDSSVSGVGCGGSACISTLSRQSQTCTRAGSGIATSSIMAVIASGSTPFSM